LEKKKETEQIFEQKQQALQAENEVFLCIWIVWKVVIILHLSQVG
jgi:hypothetical protein